MQPEERFEGLFARQAGVVHRFAVRRVDPSAVEDVVSDVFLVAWRRLDEVPAPDAERAWLLATAKWVVANHVRSRGRRRRLMDRLVAEPVPAPDQGAADDDRFDGADVAVVRAVLATLSEKDQEVLKLAEWDQLSPRECAQVLGCSAATFAVRLHRARRRFRDALLGAGHQRAPDRGPAAPGIAPSPSRWTTERTPS